MVSYIVIFFILLLKNIRQLRIVIEPFIYKNKNSSAGF